VDERRPLLALAMNQSNRGARVMRLRFAVAAVALASAVACSSQGGGPTAPSAAGGGTVAAAPDGSTLKVAGPRLLAPLGGAAAEVAPALLAEPTNGRFAALQLGTLRFQVSETADFSVRTDEGTATAPAGGLVAYRVQRVQKSGTRIYWRARAELDGAFGPWSATGEFVTSGSPPSPGGGGRTPNPPPGQRLALPNMSAQIAQWTAERPDLFPGQQCPLGVKYVNNPWQDYIVDRLRQIDTRWGYNAKPTRGSGDNGGRPVVAAGDEILYNWGSNADEGNTNEVYAVDMLTAHCGDKEARPIAPSLTWRVFTGEEPVRWTGAGRF
jgi:hypothetical protein